MLCRAELSLPDWPANQLRDVDPKNERVQGYLRAGYITPMIRQRVQATQSTTPPSPAAKRAKASE